MRKVGNCTFELKLPKLVLLLSEFVLSALTRVHTEAGTGVTCAFLWEKIEF